MTTWRFVRIGSTAAGVLAVTVLAGGCRSSDQGPLMGAAGVSVAANDSATFAVGVAPTMAPPVAVGALVAFRMSSSESGYGHLYLINADGGVTVLAEKLPLPAGAQVDYPRPDDGIRIRASAPAGIDRLVLLVTRQPFVGFADKQGSTLTRPVALTSTAEAFLEGLNEATESLPEASWAVAETRVQVIE